MYIYKNNLYIYIYIMKMNYYYVILFIIMLYSNITAVIVKNKNYKN